jgi:SAM-dependent methyltransferase
VTHYSDPTRPSYKAREVAESFGSDPGRYERSRPDYPRAMVERMVGSGPGRDVVDVGCGTGIPGRQFRAAGCRVLGVEPDERMAAVARQSGLAVEVATFETWDTAGRRFDLVLAAQAWHWIDPVAGATKAAQALVPDGRFAAFWNAFEPPDDLAGAFAEVYRRVETGLPFNPWARSALEGYMGMCNSAEQGLAESGGFAESERWRFDWERPYTRDDWLDQVPTFGGHGQIRPAKLQELLSELGDAVDAVGGSFVMGYATLVVTAVRARGRRPTVTRT